MKAFANKMNLLKHPYVKRSVRQKEGENRLLSVYWQGQKLNGMTIQKTDACLFGTLGNINFVNKIN